MDISRRRPNSFNSIIIQMKCHYQQSNRIALKSEWKRYCDVILARQKQFRVVRSMYEWVCVCVLCCVCLIQIFLSDSICKCDCLHLKHQLSTKLQQSKFFVNGGGFGNIFILLYGANVTGNKSWFTVFNYHMFGFVESMWKIQFAMKKIGKTQFEAVEKSTISDYIAK